MATRQTTSPALTEGQRFTLTAPRSYVRFGRSKLAELLQASTYEVRDGAPTLVSTGPLSTQPIVVGSIVTVANQRRQYLRSRVPGMRNPNMHINTSQPYSLWAVTELSSDRKMFSAVPLLRTSFAVTPCSDGRVEVTFHSRTFFDHDLGNYRSYSAEEFAANPSLTAKQISSMFSDEGCLDPGSWALFRTHHVRSVYSVSALPPVLVAGMQSRAQTNAVKRMYIRLRHAAPGFMYGIDQHMRSREYSENRKQLGRNIAGYFKRLHRDLTDPAFSRDTGAALQALRQRLVGAMAGAAFRRGNNIHPLWSIDPEDRYEAVMARWYAKHNLTPVRYFDCGHWSTDGGTQAMLDRYGRMGSVCSHCASNLTEVIDNYGNNVLVTTQVASSCYTWSDGTTHLQREPGIIGGRHSGKGVVGEVAPLVTRNDDYLTLGLELEMQAYNGHDREPMARAMRQKLEGSNLLTDRQLRKYLHFEEDGSTGAGGFEMVTGYSDLQTHATLLKALLCKDNGGNAYAGKLRSHDASGQSCGIHVHAARPKSLLHAMKINYFINASHNEQIVRDVARRYNTSYCTIRNVVDANKEAVQLYKDCKYLRGGSNLSAARDAIGRISSQTRYVAVNYQNRATVEFRIFRGSMVYETVMACLEFSQAVWNFCREMPATQLNTALFIQWINKTDNRKETRNLRTYLRKKGYDTIVPKARKDTPTAYVPAVDTDEALITA